MKKIASVLFLLGLMVAAGYPPHRQVSGEDVRLVGLTMARMLGMTFIYIAAFVSAIASTVIGTAVLYKILCLVYGPRKVRMRLYYLVRAIKYEDSFAD